MEAPDPAESTSPAPETPAETQPEPVVEEPETPEETTPPPLIEVTEVEQVFEHNPRNPPPTGNNANNGNINTAPPSPIRDVTVLSGGLQDGKLRLATLVADSNGGVLDIGLEPDNFTITDMKLTRVNSDSSISGSATVTDVTVQQPETQLDAVLTFDISGSMTTSDPGAAGRRSGAEEFFSKLGPIDEAAILFFSNTTVTLKQDFTSDLSLLRDALETFDDTGSTNLWDAAVDGMTRLLNHGGTGGITILLTDGQNNTSVSTSQNVIDQAQDQQARVFTIGLGNQINVQELTQIAAETGGFFLASPTAAELKDAYCRAGLGIKRGFLEIFADVSFDQLPDTGLYDLTLTLTVREGGAEFVREFEFPAALP